MFKQGNGYSGQSMSNNAVTAYSNGEKPLSKITKDDLENLRKDINISLIVFKKYCTLNARPVEHHTSKHFNSTKFYNINEVIEDINEMNIDEISKEVEHIKNIFKKKQNENKQKAKVFVIAKVTSWVGNYRNHKRPETELVAGYIIDNWFFIQSKTEYCEVKKKNLNCKGTIIVYEAKNEKDNTNKFIELLNKGKKC